MTYSSIDHPSLYNSQIEGREEEEGIPVFYWYYRRRNMSEFVLYYIQ
jgi:hypothetical protein